MSEVLIVDDELSMREFLEIWFRKAGHRVTCASDGRKAIACLEAREFDLVITDLRMPHASGLEVLARSRALHPDTPVLVITAYATTETAIQAMKEGAYDYFTKPFKLDQISITIEKALEKRRLVVENQALKSALEAPDEYEGLLGRSARMKAVFALIDRMAPTRSNVLITGESGTGKELVARAIHTRSNRANGPFMVLNCAAVPESLLESELFGHRKGAFTGATADKPGLFPAAQGGTIFLDEIGELPLSMQGKLLRVLQEKKVKAVGDVNEVPIDVRVIAATNRLLEEEVTAQRFRQDLFFRLNVLRIDLPPLRTRTEDIPLLAHHFLKRYATEFGKPMESLSADALATLMTYPFTGNVRELENLIERGVALADGPTLTPAALPSLTHTPTEPVESETSQSPDESLPDETDDLDGTLARYERRLILRALERTGGRKKAAAELLGITFRSLRYRLDKLQIEDP